MTLKVILDFFFLLKFVSTNKVRPKERASQNLYAFRIIKTRTFTSLGGKYMKAAKSRRWNRTEPHAQPRNILTESGVCLRRRIMHYKTNAPCK